MALTEQKKRFAEEYLVDFVGKAAAIRAGYAESSAAVSANRLLHEEDVILYMRACQIEQNTYAPITRERVIDELRRMATVDPRKVIHPITGLPLALQDIDDDTAAAISEVEIQDGIVTKIKFKSSDKAKALDSLGKHFNIYEDHAKASQPNVTVVVEGKDSLL